MALFVLLSLFSKKAGATKTMSPIEPVPSTYFKSFTCTLPPFEELAPTWLLAFLDANISGLPAEYKLLRKHEDEGDPVLSSSCFFAKLFAFTYGLACSNKPYPVTNACRLLACLSPAMSWLALGEDDATSEGVAGGMNVDFTSRCCEGDASTFAKTAKTKKVKFNRVPRIIMKEKCGDRALLNTCPVTASSGCH